MPSTETIQITLNGKPKEIKSGMTVTDLLTKWRMRPELVTVEINENILQKLDYDNTEIKTGDRVEFIFYMGGGTSSLKIPACHPRKLLSGIKSDLALD